MKMHDGEVGIDAGLVGRLGAVIDFGGAGIGDPAADVIAAWSVFGPAGRQAFRAVLGVDDGTWNRARGFALHQAAMIIPYYPETNPGFCHHGEAHRRRGPRRRRRVTSRLCVPAGPGAGIGGSGTAARRQSATSMTAGPWSARPASM